jgi:hypothetical protein
MPHSWLRGQLEGSPVAEEEESDALERTRHAQELQNELAECLAAAEENLKEVAANMEAVKKLKADRRALEEQRAAAGAQQPPSTHLTPSGLLPRIDLNTAMLACSAVACSVLVAVFQFVCWRAI